MTNQPMFDYIKNLHYFLIVILWFNPMINFKTKKYTRAYVRHFDLVNDPIFLSVMNNFGKGLRLDRRVARVAGAGE